LSALFGKRSANPPKLLIQSPGTCITVPVEDAVSRWNEHIVLDPLDFIARLAALVPPPKRLG
jgi:hypothetical protein